MSDISSSASDTGSRNQRVIVVANGLFGAQLAGGDVHLLHSIKAFLEAGWQVECFGGRVLQAHLAQWNLPASVISTDSKSNAVLSDATLGGKIRLFIEFFRRFVATLTQLRAIKHTDVVFSATDYWFDVLPIAFSGARLKVVILQMKAPSLREVIFRSRADVEAIRVASLYYCFSQWVSLAVLRFCKLKRVVSVQPLLQSMLRRRGYTVDETPVIPNGVEVAAAQDAAGEAKRFDVVWMGRVHRQKGIEDLLATLVFLAREIPDFRAILIGNLREALGARITELGLGSHVEFTGFVSGVEKFRWLRRARVFLMPSQHEGLPIVVGEALACELPVVAYELEMYRPYFGDLLTYVRPFALEAFQRTAASTVLRLRADGQLQNESKLAEFLLQNSWPVVEKRLAQLIET